jgi:hypothetical protein
VGPLIMINVLKTKILAFVIVIVGVAPAFAAKYSVEIRQGVQILRISGFIGMDEGDRIEPALGRARTDMPTVVLLNSEGGVHMGTVALIQALKKFSEQLTQSTGSGVWGYVEAYCASNCVAVYVSLPNLMVNARAWFGFHGSSFQGRVHPLATQKYLELLVGGGVSDLWLSQNRSVFSDTRIRWMRPAHLISQGFGPLSQSSFADLNGLILKVQREVH